MKLSDNINKAFLTSRLNHIMKLFGLKKTELSLILNCSYNSIVKMLDSRTNYHLNLEQLKSLLDYTGITLEDFFSNKSTLELTKGKLEESIWKNINTKN